MKWATVDEARAELATSAWALVGDAEGGIDLLNLASRFGTPAPSSMSGPLLDTLEAQDADVARRRSLSAEVGRGRFPWHTEGSHWPTPPRYFMLRFTSGDPAPTLLAPFSSLAFSTDDIQLLRRSMFRVASPRGKFLTTILESRGRSIGDIVRFDRRVLHPATPEAWRAAHRVDQVLDSHDPITIDWQSGLILIVDNWRVLHSRESVAGERTIERVLVRA